MHIFIHNSFFYIYIGQERSPDTITSITAATALVTKKTEIIKILTFKLAGNLSLVLLYFFGEFKHASEIEPRNTDRKRNDDSKLHSSEIIFAVFVNHVHASKC